MFQFLLDLTRKPQQPPKPPIVRSPSSASSVDTWPIVDDDWHGEKQSWSFKDDYVSFPSLEIARDDHDDDDNNDCL